MNHYKYSSLLLLCALLATPAFSAEPPSRLQFAVDFDTGCRPGDQFGTSGDKVINQLQSKPAEGKEPFRKFSDIRNTLNGKTGAWTATLTNGAPFTSSFLRFDVPAGTPLAGRFELFQAPASERKGAWFVAFDYARLAEGKGGPELLVVELKSRTGRIIAAPAMWYGAWLGEWKNARSNRDLPLGKVVRIRLELDLDQGRYIWRVNGESAETGKIGATEFGGASFVLSGKTSKEALSFGLDNIQVGRMAGLPATVQTAQEQGVAAPVRREPAVAVMPVAARRDAPAATLRPEARRTGKDGGPLPAARTADFLDSLGLNVIVNDDERYDQITVPRLAELGIRHLRVGLRKADQVDYRGDGAIMLRNIKDLGRRGYKITGIWNCWHTMAEFVTICESLLPDALYQVEGPNEPWIKNENFKWQGQGWPQGPRLFMQDMHATVRGNDAMKHLPIISFSGTTSAYGSIEEWVDYGCEHLYTDNGAAITENDELQRKIDRCRNTNYPTAPLQFTETGYNAGGEDAGIRPTSAWTQARGVPRLFLEGYRHGLARFFVYALNARDDKGFSLVEPDGTPKAAFNAVRSMIAILRDEGTTATQFAPGGLEVAIESDIPSVHHVLLQKSDGRFYLCLWNDVDGWNENTGEDRVNPDRDVTLTFGQVPKSLRLFRPVTDGTDVIEHRERVAGKELIKVPDHPVIVEIVP